MNGFEEVVGTRKRLRELSKQPSARAINKVIDHIDELCRRFIAASPFVLVASRGGDGRIDVSPKGDPPGFVCVLDDKTLAIPDRPGNHRLDTFDPTPTCVACKIGKEAPQLPAGLWAYRYGPLANHRTTGPTD